MLAVVYDRHLRKERYMRVRTDFAALNCPPRLPSPSHSYQIVDLSAVAGGAAVLSITTRVAGQFLFQRLTRGIAVFGFAGLQGSTVAGTCYSGIVSFDVYSDIYEQPRLTLVHEVFHRRGDGKGGQGCQEKCGELHVFENVVVWCLIDLIVVVVR